MTSGGVFGWVIVLSTPARSTVSEGSGLLARKKPMPGSRMSRSREIPARSRAATRALKKASIRARMEVESPTFRVV